MNPRERITKRIAMEFKDGDYVNLGIGMPVMVANYIPKDIHIMLHGENGVLGTGSIIEGGCDCSDYTDAGGNNISYVKGAAFFDSAISFAIIRGGHIDITVLGALEVDQEGNLASWMVPGRKVTGMGGAMDLVCGAKKVIVAMEHLSKKGVSKISTKCKLPLTAMNEVDMIVTEMAVIERVENIGLILKEIAPGLSVEDVVNATEAELIISDNLKIMNIN
jgi:acetate CoA/acetoacetate CoA-transferase beta subunit